MPSQPVATLPGPAVRRAHQATLATLAALVLQGLAWELWLAPTGSGTLALKVLPLLLAVPGLLRHRLYTARWLALVVWLYVMEGLMRGVTERGLSQALAWLATALALALFTAATAYIRLRLRSAAAAA